MKQRLLILATLSLSLALTGHAQKKSKKEKETIMQNEKTQYSKVDSLSYSLGVNIGVNLKQQGFDELNLEVLNKAFQDVYNNKALDISNEEATQYITLYMQDLQKAKFEKNVAEGKKFLEENKKKKGVVTLPSGLQYEVIKEGKGPKPKATDKVTTHYHGMLIDGSVFDSSVDRGQPATFPVNGVIQGWVEALQLMNQGSKWRLYIPSNLAYGERGSGPKIGPNTTLIFDVELISINQ
jgi:FKBP-type peptidyl-prolyl cis-trans isomerase FklB